MELHERLDSKSMEMKWYKYMKEGINNKMKGETNACPKHGDTLVRRW